MVIDETWVNGFPGAVTVCDEHGTMIWMNDKAAAGYRDAGGRALLGSNVLACHEGESRKKVAALFEERRTNVYTIQKGGIRKLIYQSPWYRDGAFAGIVELSMEIPQEIPEFIRG